MSKPEKEGTVTHQTTPLSKVDLKKHLAVTIVKCFIAEATAVTFAEIAKTKAAVATKEPGHPFMPPPLALSSTLPLKED